MNSSSGTVSGDTSFFDYEVESYSDTDTTTLYSNRSISINTSTGVVSGDTAFFNYTVDYDKETEQTTKYVTKVIRIENSSKRVVTGDTAFFNYTTDYRLEGSHEETDTLTKSISVAAKCQKRVGTTGGECVTSVTGDTSYCTYTTTYSGTGTPSACSGSNVSYTPCLLLTAGTPRFKSVTWDKTLTSGGYTYTYKSQTGNTGTRCTATYETTKNVGDYTYFFDTASYKSPVTSGGTTYTYSSSFSKSDFQVSARFKYTGTTTVKKYKLTNVSYKSPVTYSGTTYYYSSGFTSSSTSASGKWRYTGTTSVTKYRFSNVDYKTPVSYGGRSYTYYSSFTWDDTSASGKWRYPSTSYVTRYKFTSVDYKTPVSSGGYTWYYNSGFSWSNTSASGIWYYQTTTYGDYYLEDVTWDSSITVGDNTYTYYSGNLTDGNVTSRQGSFRRYVTSTTDTTLCYSKFTFDASTGKITWSHRDGSSTYYDKVENGFTSDIDDLSYNTYTHNSTNWNYSGPGSIVSSDKTSLTLSIPTVAWEWYKNGVLYDSGDAIEVNGEEVDDLEVK